MPDLPGWAPLAGAIARVRSFFRSVFNRDTVEAGIREEFQHHIDLRTDALVAQGLTRQRASKQARVEFGHMETHRHDARESRGLRWFDGIRFSWIDIKLGVRMLFKYPMLSLAAVFALAVGIPVGLAPTHLARAVMAPLPGDGDNRVRAIRYWDPVTVGVATTGYAEFDFWSRELKSFSALTAFRTMSFNEASADGRAEPVAGAQISSSAFEVLGVTPQLGRALVAGDGERGVPDVAVIGHGLWKSRFDSDPRIIGRTIRVGRVMTTVVGVMPEGFRFPSYEQLWLPMRTESFGGAGVGIRVQIVGRLADGVSAEQAQAELDARRLPPLADANDARRRDRLRPEIVPFGLLYMGLPQGGLESMPEYYVIQIATGVLLLVACGNVAMLVFARTATRFKEIAIRTALGASRSRIVSQIFAETFILAVLAAGVGVFLINWVLQHVNLAALAGQSAMPYWLSLGVTTETVIRAFVLATVSATVAGVVPAIRITGRAVYQNMSGQSGIRFGKVTGALVIADIAMAVAAVGLSMAMVSNLTNLRESERAAGIPAAEYLAVEFRMLDDEFTTYGGGDRSGLAERLGASQRALVTALESEPGVRVGIAIADALPGMEHRSQPIEIDGVEPSPDAPQRWVRAARVDVNYFHALDRTVIAGRDFNSSDVAGDRAAVIVNAPFVERMLEGGDAIGRRVRFPKSAGADAAKWYEIVGVVPHLGVNMVNVESGQAVYFPASAGEINPMQIGIHARASPVQLAPRVRELAAAIDRDLVMGQVVALNDVRQGDWYLVAGIGAGLSLLAMVLVALATSGLYAMLSLSVTERTREIGIRTALGASKRNLVMVILRRSVWQIAVGALIGVPVAARFVYELGGNSDAAGGSIHALLVATALAAGIVMVVGLSSCLVPTRRVLAIDASMAMRAEG